MDLRTKICRKGIEIQKSDITAEDLLKMVTKNAAQVLGIADDVGTLTPGKKVDYLIIKAPRVSENTDIYTQLIQQTKTYHIQKVVVNGQTLKSIN